MIKIIVFDLMTILNKNNDIKLNTEEKELIKLLEKSKEDYEYLENARKIIKKDSTIMRITEEIIGKIYCKSETDLFKRIKDKSENLKIIIIADYVSYIRNFIGETFNVEYVSDILISAETHKYKQQTKIYELILDRYNVFPNEVLFVDSNEESLHAAMQSGVKTICVKDKSKVYELVSCHIENDLY